MPEPLPTPPTWAPGCVRTQPGPIPQPSSATSPDLDQATLRHGAGHHASTHPVRPAARDTSGPPAPGTPGHTSSVLTCAESSCVESAPSSISRAVQPELEERLSNLTWAGFDATHLVRSAAAVGPCPTTTPRQPSGGASSTSYRKRRTSTPQPPPSQRLGARPQHHPTSGHPCRARRRLPCSARAAETRPPSRRLVCVSADSVCRTPPISIKSRRRSRRFVCLASLRAASRRHGLITQSDLLAGRPSIYLAIATDLLATLMVLRGSPSASWVFHLVEGCITYRLFVMPPGGSGARSGGSHHDALAIRDRTRRRTGRLVNALRRRRRPQESTSP